MKTVHKKVTRTTALNILLPHENRENLNNLFRRYSQKSSSNSNSISSVGDGGAQVSAAAADAFFLAAAMGAGLIGMVTSDSDWCQKTTGHRKIMTYPVWTRWDWHSAYYVSCPYPWHKISVLFQNFNNKRMVKLNKEPYLL